MAVVKIFLIIVPLILTISQAADIPTAKPASPTTVCKSTPDPAYCKSILPHYNQSANVYDYGRFCVRKSLSQSRKFLLLINKYLSHPESLSTPAFRALQDCRYLAQSNIDFLLSSFQTVNTTNKVLSTEKSDDTLTYLSAILTNLQTCYDGIASTSSAWSIKNGIFSPLKNDTKLYSVSLGLFNRGWVPRIRQKSVRRPRHGKRPLRHGQMPNMKMSAKKHAIYGSIHNRRLLQSSDDDGDVIVSDIVTVSQDGSEDFTTITDAVKAAPNNSLASAGYFIIYVTAGVYEEYVLIPTNKRYLLMVGDGINQTILTGNRSVGDGWTTFNSGTFTVTAPGFVAVNMTFRNTAGSIKHQAVAVRNGADLSAFYSCSFEGYQDTLYTHSLRQFYKECDIYGTVDFIFGNAAVIFQNCNIYPRQPLKGQFNAITAQGRTDPNQNTGTSILNCTIKATNDLASSNFTVKTYLGRPWKQYSRTVYLQSYMGSLINSAGWSIWDGDFALNTSYYGEYKNYGPGANTSGRVTWPGFHIMSSTNATNFTVSTFLLGDDWLPDSGVPYFGGLY